VSRVKLLTFMELDVNRISYRHYLHCYDRYFSSGVQRV
jgi:hypothetical protein